MPDSITVEENNVTSQTLSTECPRVLKGMDCVQNAIGNDNCINIILITFYYLYS